MRLAISLISGVLTSLNARIEESSVGTKLPSFAMNGASRTTSMVASTFVLATVSVTIFLV